MDRRVFVGLHALAMLAVGAVSLLRAESAIDWEPHLSVPWVVVASLFLLVEGTALHIEIRRETHTLSLSALPLLLGLLSLTPISLVLARLVGGTVALVAIRRRTGLKLVWNLALYLAETAVAAVVATFALIDGPPSSVQSWLLLLAAVLVAELIGLISVPIVIMIAESEIRVSLFGQIGRSQLIAVVSATFAIVAAAAIRDLPWLAAFAAVPLVGVGWLLHQFGQLGKAHHDLRQLHSFTTAIDGRDPITTGLGQLATILRASATAIAVRNNDQHFTVMLHRDGVIVEREIATTSLRENLDGVVAISTGSELTELAELVEQLGHRAGLAIGVEDHAGSTGYILVLDRLGASNHFRDDEKQLFGSLAANLAARISANQLLDQLELQARTDALTGLANRSAIEAELQRRIDDETIESVAVLMVDLDRFKDVNDSLGHQFGDALLQLIADRLRDYLRDDDLAGRLGGDEFAIVVDIGTNTDLDLQLRSLAERLTSPVGLDGIVLEIGSSIGVACWPSDANSGSDLLRLADIAMYEAKRTRHSWVRYDPSIDHASADRLALLGEVRDAMQQRHLGIHLQPQVRSGNGTLVGAEALLRWHHPERGLIPPGDFLPLAEQSSLAGPITQHVINEAITAIDRIKPEAPDLTIWVNLTARDLLDEKLAPTVATALLRSGTNPSQLGFEVTESSLIINIDTAIATLCALRDLGCPTSVDDFGTGFASLQYLQRLPVNEIKIDQSFVSDAATNPDSVAIVRSTTRLIQDLGKSVVAEGVEDQATLDLLTEIGCDTIQGYHISRPLDIDTFINWARNNATNGLATDPTPANTATTR